MRCLTLTCKIDHPHPPRICLSVDSSDELADIPISRIVIAIEIILPTLLGLFIGVER